LYPGYISRALNSQLLLPHDVLRIVSKIIPDLQPGQETARYPLLRIISQAVTLWKPHSPLSEHIQIFWNIEQILHQFSSRDDLGQDHVLFIEGLDVWKKLLTSQSLRPLLKAEKKNNPGIVSTTIAELDQWKSFENDVQDLRGAAANKLPLDKVHELETILGDFLLDLASANGVIAGTEPDLPKIPVLETRVALMIFFISLVCCHLSLLTSRENVWASVRRMKYGPQSIVLQKMFRVLKFSPP
jgi:hypothetical protein